MLFRQSNTSGRRSRNLAITEQKLSHLVVDKVKSYKVRVILLFSLLINYILLKINFLLLLPSRKTIKSFVNSNISLSKGISLNKCYNAVFSLRFKQTICIA